MKTSSYPIAHTRLPVHMRRLDGAPQILGVIRSFPFPVSYSSFASLPSHSSLNRVFVSRRFFPGVELSSRVSGRYSFCVVPVMSLQLWPYCRVHPYNFTNPGSHLPSDSSVSFTYPQCMNSCCRERAPPTIST